MKIHEYNQMYKHLIRKPDKLSKEEKKKVVEDHYKKAEQPKSKPMPIVKYIDTMNRLYSNYDESEDPRYIDPLEMQKIKEAIPVSPMVKKPKKPSWKYESWSDGIENLEKEKKLKVAGIKDSSLYKLLKNPKVIGVDLGHDTILEIINLIQNSGLVKKPKPKPTISIEEEINQIAHKRKLAENKLFGLNEEFAKQKLRERMS